MMTSSSRDEVLTARTDIAGNANSTGHLINDTSIPQRSPGVHVFRDPMTEKLFWKVGIIFVISALVIIGSFAVLFGFSYTRRRFSLRRFRRRQPQQVLAFENQLHVTGDEMPEVAPDPHDAHVTVHQSCSGGMRRWSRDRVGDGDGDDDDDVPRPRSRSNSRSRSLSPGTGARSRSAQKPGQHDLDDDLMSKGLQRLENARLAFKDDSTKYAEYESTKERIDASI